MEDSSQEILEPSLKSLFIEMRFEEVPLASGTGFLVRKLDRVFLVTNRHNFTGRRQDDGACLSRHGGTPDRVVVWHNSSAFITEWISAEYKLLDEGGIRRWHEHPTLGRQADIVALELTVSSEIGVRPYAVGRQSPEMIVRPADAVSVVGFPFGQTGGGKFAIWATGFIATEPAIDFNELPIFLIDCRTRPGQSGSPVIAHRNGGSIPMVGSSTSNYYIGPVTNLIGIYSGRISDKSDLGMVWKRSAIDALLGAIE